MATKLEVEFAFDIGQIVTMKAMVEICEPCELQPLVVLEQHSVTCHGGTQRVYMCRALHRRRVFGQEQAAFSGSLSNGIFHQVLEPELAPFPEEAKSAALRAVEEARYREKVAAKQK